MFACLLVVEIFLLLSDFYFRIICDCKFTLSRGSQNLGAILCLCVIFEFELLCLKFDINHLRYRYYSTSTGSRALFIY
jgi:hypothetical protein